jgi:hypothetical protein
VKLSHDHPPATRGKIVVWGLLASYPFGGMTWQVLHYAAGLRRLGYDVWYVEDSDRYLLSAKDFSRTRESAANVEYLACYMEAIGLGDRWVFRPPRNPEATCGALDFDGLQVLYREADAVINVCGAQELLPWHDAIRCLVYVQTDPVSDQVAVASGDAAKIAELDAYDHLFTYGEHLGEDGCLVPVERYQWHKTRPPVCVDWWDDAPPPAAGAPLTSVLKWQHEAKDVQWRGATWHWSKHREFRRFLRVAQRSPLELELAISSVPAPDLDELHRHGWRTRPSSSAADPGSYRDFIRSSAGEFTAAKEQYVVPRSGWFSDRSVCYLAAKRPVITQDTGFSTYFPTGEGLFAFSTVDEAVAAIEAVSRDYARHSGRAHEIAAEYFAAERVLADMMRIVERVAV